MQGLLKQPSQKEITVISKEDCPAYDRRLLPQYLAGRVEEKDLFLCAQGFYAAHNVFFEKASEVARLDTKKQRVVLKDNAKIPYEYLVIASGEETRLPDIPGTGKDGVVAFAGFESVKEIRQRLSFASLVCVAGRPKECAMFAEIAQAAGKEVKVISPAPPPEGFSAGQKTEWLQGVRVTEVIGEGKELKAIKLSNGKAIGASLVVFAPHPSPASGFLKESGVVTSAGGYVIVDKNLRTNLENIFACGAVAREEGALETEKSWEDSCGEGLFVAENLISLLEGGKSLCQQIS